VFPISHEESFYMSYKQKVSGLRYSLACLIILIFIASGVSAAQEAEECAEGLRLFEYENLATDPVCIPEDPQRVVVLDTGELDNALALGASIIGAPIGDAVQYQAYVSDQLEGIADTGTISEPNFEAILDLEPDLILGSFQRYEAIYDQLSAIAPTVLTQSLRVPWQQNFLLHAAALNKTEEAEQLLADYDAHVAEVQTALGNALDTTTISIIRFRPGQVRLYLKSSFIGYILQDVGLQRPPAQDEDVFSAEISIEQMQDADADYIFITGYDIEDSERATFLESPLWQTLSAVENGRAIDVNDDTWIAGLGIQAANLVLDDLQALLAPADPAATEETASAETGAAFPVTLIHSLGTIEIPAAPERVITLSAGDSDAAYGLGVVPVAIAPNPYVEDGMWPWLEGIYNPEQTEILPQGEISFEQLVGLQPDLILAGGRYNTTDLYPSLSEIAPTTAWINASFTDTWQEQTLQSGQALGLEAEAQALIEETESQIAAVGTTYPALIGKTFSLSFLHDETSINTIYSQEDFAVQFFQELGFVLTPELAELAEEEGNFQGALSLETLNLIDADLVVLAFGSPEVQAAYEANPLYQQLGAVAEGRVVVVDLSAVTQMRAPSVLGIRWILELLQPAFEALAAR
jgi:iron complex transport system substrate-binding protein